MAAMRVSREREPRAMFGDAIGDRRDVREHEAAVVFLHAGERALDVVVACAVSASSMPTMSKGR